MKHLLAALLLGLAGCMGPLKPGTAGVVRPDGTQLHVKQSENPQNSTKQVYRHTEQKSLDNGVPVQRTEEVIETTIGAAQKDTAREIGAKLSSLKGIVWLGVLVFLFGAASFVYPPLKVIVGGSVTTSAVITLAGLALIVLPTLIVGNELLILGGCIGIAVIYWFSHRHGKLQGFVDANRDGIDDRNQ